MIIFNVITLFPELFDAFLQHLPFSRAIEKGIIQINLIQLRDFAIDERGTVDGRPFGGGVGMLLRIEPVYKALESVHNSVGTVKKEEKTSIIALAPSGKKFTQEKSQQLTKKEVITLICGRYEGMDERIKTHLATEVISVGDYVLSGGELPALTIMETVTRLLPGVLEKEEAIAIESFSRELGNGGHRESGSVEFPQYTRPKEFKGLKVPEVLLSGNHGEILKWRESTKNFNDRNKKVS
ncbi:MAG TPA: tRNA (guanosine(37)-N1)-methyltransferase TrmD [candidate division WWE3 bacterium]|uniref:tRNA (guanine-N(1)-)-methyltransferase n=1 Tax=candidate division WWE3 bacterium TaxID=2053526 RepID=A0A7C1DG74_UNCKA|nr:tRNA (guanosine(37)-N1)-methyltransferase TrmD [candidate division WWE3 bacterium]